MVDFLAFGATAGGVAAEDFGFFEAGDFAIRSSVQQTR